MSESQPESLSDLLSDPNLPEFEGNPVELLAAEKMDRMARIGQVAYRHPSIALKIGLHGGEFSPDEAFERIVEDHTLATAGLIRYLLEETNLDAEKRAHLTDQFADIIAK